MPSPSDAPQPLTTRLLWWALLGLAVIATIGFGYAVTQRVLYPHELEWMEGALADHMGDPWQDMRYYRGMALAILEGAEEGVYDW